MRYTSAVLAALAWLCTSVRADAQPIAQKIAASRRELRTAGLFTSAQLSLLWVRRVSGLGGQDQGIGYTGTLGWGFTRTVAVFGSFDSQLTHTWGDSLEGATYVPTFGMYRFHALGAGVRVHGAITPTVRTYLSTAITGWRRPFTAGTAGTMAGGIQLYRIPGVVLDVGVDHLSFLSVRRTGTPSGHRLSDPASAIRLRAGATYWRRSRH